MPFFSTRLPISSIKNLGDYSNKFSDFSWVYYFIVNLVLKKFKFQSMLGVGFTNINFIRILNFIFFIIVSVILLKY